MLNIYAMAYRGKYRPVNPRKYNGNIDDIVFRSLWERKFMVHLDLSSSIIKWSSESIVVPYTSPVDGKRHRYFTDFWLRVKEIDGTIKEKLIEIKPFAQCYAPKVRKRKTTKYIREVRTYGVNQAKWAAAQDFADLNKMEFMVLTEKGMLKDGQFYPSESKIF